MMQENVKKKSLLWRLIWIMVPGALLASGVTALAQDNDNIPQGLSTGVLVVCVLLGLAFYIYISLALQTIANKTNTPNAWMAWIPIANIFLMLSVAKKPMWWFILYLIPLVSIVIAIMVWMAIAEQRGKPSWWGILMIVPVANLIVPGYLAWAD